MGTPLSSESNGKAEAPAHAGRGEEWKRWKRLREVWRFSWTWVDLLWLVFLAGLAALPPRDEIHKQVILLAFGVFQLYEARLIALHPRRGCAAAVAVKIGLATLLIAHTGQVAINSSYYPIYYIPVVTAAMLFGPWGTLGWTAAASGAYLGNLWPALHQYSLDPTGAQELALRIFFFFLLALIINRFVMETRGQRDLFRQAAESLENANRQLRLAQAEARRSERLAALGQLSAGLAHEIRNPLAVIKGSAEMLQKTVDAGQAVAVELAEYISSEVNRVNLLVTRFLDFARPLQLDRQPAEIGALLDQAVAEARERWPAAGVEVEAAYRESAAALPRLRLDAVLCERAFANLAANAFEALAAAPPSGGGRLRISAEAAGEGGAAGVLVRFSDNGPGVAGELREQVFNPFFTTKPAGVGLGLAIVSKIADQHGGWLRLLDTAAGATFEVYLPDADHPHR